MPCKIWRKTDLWFGKWHEQFGKLSPEHLKVSKLGLWWNAFFQRTKCKNKKLRAIWRKIWRRMDLPFQNSHKEFDEFWLEHSKVSNVFPLMGCFWPKYIMFELKKYIGVILLDTGEWCKIWKRIDLSNQNWHEEVNKFWPKHSKI